MSESDHAPGRPQITRVVAPNPGPMTLEGTNSYLVGSGPAWLIDPGPADPDHIRALIERASALGGIGGVVITHSHLDHAAGAGMLGIEPAWGVAGDSDETGSLAAAAATAAGPLPVNAQGEAAGSVPGAGPPAQAGPFSVLATPGHASDHVCFLWEDVAFCGDLILGRGSSIVPPAAGGGSLAAYMRSLELLERERPALLCPGHGPWITDPAAKIAEYREHRLSRERDLLAALEAGEREREALLDAAWGDVPEPMRPAAALAMQAHLEKLAAEGLMPAANLGSG